MKNESKCASLENCFKNVSEWISVVCGLAQQVLLLLYCARVRECVREYVRECMRECVMCNCILTF